MKQQRRLLFFALALLFIGSASTQPRAATPTTQEADGAERISIADFKTLLATHKPVTVIDVRGDSEQKIKGAIHVPLADIEARLAEIPRDREIVTYCA